jgi:primosomal replication protein N
LRNRFDGRAIETVNYIPWLQTGVDRIKTVRLSNHNDTFRDAQIIRQQGKELMIQVQGENSLVPDAIAQCSRLRAAGFLKHA